MGKQSRGNTPTKGRSRSNHKPKYAEQQRYTQRGLNKKKLVQNVRKSNSAAVAHLAQSFVAPGDTPPLRLPSSYHTEVKSFSYVTSVATVAGRESIFHFFKDPSRAMIAQVKVDFSSVYTWMFHPPTMVRNTTPGSPLDLNPRQLDPSAYIVPIGKSATLFVDQDPVPIMPIYATSVALQSEVGITRSEPHGPVIAGSLARIDDARYVHNGGERMSIIVGFEPPTGVIPAGGGLTLNFNFMRYTGTNTPPIRVTTAIAPVTFPAGVGTTSVETLTDTLLPGYYYLQLTRFTISGSGTEFDYGSVKVTVRQFVDTGATVWGVTMLPVMYEWPALGSTLFSKARVNAMSALMTNTTATAYAEGDVFTCASIGDMPWFNADRVSLKRSSQAKGGYVGPLKKGAYTWFPPSQDKSLDSFAELQDGTKDYLAAVGWQGFPRHFLGDDVYHTMILVDQDPTNISQFLLKIHMHVEFAHESSEWFDRQPSMLTTAALDEVALSLAKAPVFTENWIHLAQLWQAIKRGAAEVARAGLGAAGKAAIFELGALLL